MVIGGVNLLKNSDFSKGTESWSGVRGSVEVIKDRITVLKFTSNPNDNGAHYPSQENIKIGHVETMITASMWIYTEEILTVFFKIGQIVPGQVLENETTQTFTTTAKGWTFLSVTARHTTQNGDVRVMAQLGQETQTRTIYIYHPKVELGNIATNWSLSPYDYVSLESRIKTLEEKLKS